MAELQTLIAAAYDAAAIKYFGAFANTNRGEDSNR